MVGLVGGVVNGAPMDGYTSFGGVEEPAAIELGEVFDGFGGEVGQGLVGDAIASRGFVGGGALDRTLNVI